MVMTFHKSFIVLTFKIHLKTSQHLPTIKVYTFHPGLRASMHSALSLINVNTQDRTTVKYMMYNIHGIDTISI